MLTQALRRHIEAHGGDVFTSSPVDEILMEGSRAVGIRVGTDIVTGRAVLGASCHVDLAAPLSLLLLVPSLVCVRSVSISQDSSHGGPRAQEGAQERTEGRSSA